MTPVGFVRNTLIGRVRAWFNDLERGGRPVERSANALLPPDSVAWRVHGDVTSMRVGGIAAPLVPRPAVWEATPGVAGTLRWAFGGGIRKPRLRTLGEPLYPALVEES